MPITNFPQGVSSFGIPLVGSGPILASGNVLWVDDSQSFASDDVNHGGGIAFPLKTAAFAMTLVTANNGDVVIFGPGHSQTIATMLALTTKALTTIVSLKFGTSWVMGASGILMASAGDQLVVGAPKALPASTTGTIFTVAGGPILVKELYGIVTTVIQSQATTLKFSTLATGLSAVDISGTADLNAAAVGTVISMTGVLATGAVLSANQTHLGQASTDFVGPGAINVITVATSTGAVQWYLRYQPLAPGAYCVPA